MRESGSPAGVRQGIEPVPSRVLLTAYLVTGNLEQAEQAVLKGMERWNPDVDPVEALVRRVLADAVSAPAAAADGKRPRWNLPAELLAVLTLASPLRSCFVLRSLAGLSSHVCAQLLQLAPEQVDEYTGAAHQELGRHTTSEVSRSSPD